MSDAGFDWSSAMEQLKAGVDLLRNTVGLFKDVKDALPAGEKRDAITKAIDQSEKQLQIAEAQIAAGLGYQLCHCQFPPPIMLTAGYFNGRGSPPQTGPVYECPRCGLNTAAPFSFTRTQRVYGAP